MGDVPAFFVPETAPEEEESRYSDLAWLASRPVPSLEQRVFSITYVHDGEEWTATVGQRLRSDLATVMAIFPGTYPGDSYVVVTQLGQNGPSAWGYPCFLAGRPKFTTYFSMESKP